LKSPAGITSVLRNGKRLYGQYISLYFTPSEHLALAILVKKKVGTAVQRNKAKRWIREIYRQEKRNFLFPSKLLVMINKHFSQLDFSVVKSDFLHLLAKSNMKEP